MNTSALKAFAPAVRKQLIEAVSRKLDFVLSARTPDYLDTYASQVLRCENLLQQIAKDSSSASPTPGLTGLPPFVIWMLVAGTLSCPRSHGDSAEDTQPEISTMARAGAMPEGLRRYTNLHA